MIAYKAISDKIKNNSGLALALNGLDKAITYITVLLYFGLLFIGYTLIPEDRGVLLYRSILVPGVSFLLVSLFRKNISFPRPYEVYGFTPALNKDTVGQSFPSKHTFSIFMIAFAWGQYSIPVCIIILIMGVTLATIRVIGGVHFLRDVVAGAAMAMIISIICYGIFSGVFGLLMLPF